MASFRAHTWLSSSARGILSPLSNARYSLRGKKYVVWTPPASSLALATCALSSHARSHSTHHPTTSIASERVPFWTSHDQVLASHDLLYSTRRGLHQTLNSSYNRTLSGTLVALPRGVESGRRGRSYHTSQTIYVPDKKAMVEKAVDSLKEKKKSAFKTDESVAVLKPSLPQRAWNAVVHTYHGFRLLGLDTRVAIRLLWKTMKGQSLTRRELKQFRRTVADIFRVVPFSVFLIIPFMELLLPVYLFFFPGALPSTFQTSDSKAMKKKKQLKVKIQMARFLQETIKDMSVSSKNPNKKESVEEFIRFNEKIHNSGKQATTEEILKFSQLFEDELTLDNLSRPQLVALCKFQLRMKLRQLQADDVLILKESVDSMTQAELQAASQARGMRALGMPESILKSQLEQWLDLHLVKKIPASLLLLSRALYLPENTPPSDALQATLSTLPESVLDEAEVLVADTSGESVDNKTRLDLIRQQEEFIKSEAEEREIEKKEQVSMTTPGAEDEEEMVDKAPITSASQTPPIEHTEEADQEVVISAEELKELSQAVLSLKADQDREALEELKEDREEYIEDVADLAEECEDEIKESKGSARLGRRVDSMISKIDSALQSLDDTTDNPTLEEMRKERSDVIPTAKLEEALKVLKGLSGEAKSRNIVAILDKDHDGNINIDEIAEIIESLALEDTEIKPKHIKQIKELIKKEVILEILEEQEEELSKNKQ